MITAATPRPKLPPARLAIAAPVDLAAPELEDVDEDLEEDLEVPVGVVEEPEAPDNKLAPAVMITGMVLISVGSTVVTDPLVIVMTGTSVVAV